MIGFIVVLIYCRGRHISIISDLDWWWPRSSVSGYYAICAPHVVWGAPATIQKTFMALLTRVPPDQVPLRDTLLGNSCWHYLVSDVIARSEPAPEHCASSNGMGGLFWLAISRFGVALRDHAQCHTSAFKSELLAATSLSLRRGRAKAAAEAPWG